jgi:hypothetical protein
MFFNQYDDSNEGLPVRLELCFNILREFNYTRVARGRNLSSESTKLNESAVIFKFSTTK